MIDWITEHALSLMHLPIAYLLIRKGVRELAENKFFSVCWLCMGIGILPLTIMAMQNSSNIWGGDFQSSQSGHVEDIKGIVPVTNIVEGEISGTEKLDEY
jgi:hypothetical protein